MKKRTFVKKIIITLIVIPVFYYDIKSINMILYTIKTGIFGYHQDISTSITRIETLLEEKYGEKFEVVEYGYKLYCDALVRPFSHPECFFTVRYHFTDTDDGISYDTYVKRNVELKFKHLAEGKLTDFKYDHYVDVSINNSADVPSSDPDISIEEFKKIYPQETTPSYHIFLTYDTLKEISYEELYRYVNSIAKIPEQDNAFVVTFFIDAAHFDPVVEASKNGKSIYDVIGERNDNYVTLAQALKNRRLDLEYKRYCYMMNELKKEVGITDQKS